MGEMTTRKATDVPRCSTCRQPSPCAHVRAIVAEADARATTPTDPAAGGDLPALRETPDWTHDGLVGWYVGEFDIELDQTSQHGAEVRLADRALNPGQVRRMRQVFDEIDRRLATPAAPGEIDADLPLVGIAFDAMERSARYDGRTPRHTYADVIAGVTAVLDVLDPPAPTPSTAAPDAPDA